MKKYITQRRGITLVEIMVVLAIIGILITGLSVSYMSYQARSRDSMRVMHIWRLVIGHGVYFNDFESYPNPIDGCINTGALRKSIDTPPMDPLESKDNGCGPNGHYAYGVGSGVSNGGSGFIVMAKMENPNGGNYGGNVNGMTGDTVAQSTYSLATTATSKGQGQYYIQTR